MASYKKTKANNRTSVSSLEKINFLKEQKTQPQSGFSMISSKEEEILKKSDRKFLSENNFNFDLAGNFKCGERYLLKHYYTLIMNDEFKLFRAIDNSLNWIGRDGKIISDEDLLIVEEYLPKKKKAFINNYRNVNEIAFIATRVVTANIWKSNSEFDNANLTVDDRKITKNKIANEETKMETQTAENMNESPESVQILVIQQQEEILVENEVKLDSITTDEKPIMNTQSAINETPEEILVRENSEENKQSNEKFDKILAQMEMLQTTLNEVMKQNALLMLELKKKDEIIASMIQQSKIEVKEEIVFTTEKVEQKSLETEVKVTGTLPKVPKSTVKKTKKSKNQEIAPVVIESEISKFTDDGIDIKLDLGENPTQKEAMEVLQNKISLTPEMERKIINASKRDVTAEKVEKLYNEKLSENLQKSKQVLRVAAEKPKSISQPKVARSSTLLVFTPNQKLKAARDPNAPKGILPARWGAMKVAAGSDEEKLNAGIKKEYFTIFKSQFFARQVKWRAEQPTIKNPFLLSYKVVWETLDKNTNANIWHAILEWEKAAKNFVPKVKTTKVVSKNNKQ